MHGGYKERGNVLRFGSVRARGQLAPGRHRHRTRRCILRFTGGGWCVRSYESGNISISQKAKKSRGIFVRRKKMKKFDLSFWVL